MSAVLRSLVGKNSILRQKVRSMREQRVRDDLTHLRMYFAHDVAAQERARTVTPDGGM